MRVLSVYVSVKRSSAARAGTLTRWNATSMSMPSGSPRVRLQPIYSDRSLEAIQMRYRENAGVINRRRISACHAARLTCSLFINCRGPGSVFRTPATFLDFPGIFDYYSLFYSLIMQFVVMCVQDSLIRELMD